MDAQIHNLYSSPYFDITDFKCQCLECAKSKTEYQDTFSFSFVRKGNFYFNIFRDSLDAYTGCVLINKPGYDYTVTHVEDMPDECTILTFKNAFYERIRDEFQSRAPWFLSKTDLQSLLLKCTPELDYLHVSLLQKIRSGRSVLLEIEPLVIEIIRSVLTRLAGYQAQDVLPTRLKKHHLNTLELAKEYLHNQYTTNISLVDLAEHCHVSPFHFSRIFKTFTQYSPLQYLQIYRLKQAEWMLKTTDLPVTEVAFSAGFNSIDYFSSAFKHKYKAAPSAYRLSSH